MYELLIEAGVETDLKRLSPHTFHRVIARVKALAGNPRPSGCRKITGSKSDWRIRVSDYRVVYSIDDESRAVYILRVRHRSEAYR